ncbi:hypothetical protein [Bacillus sp. AFS040349]
MHLHGQEFKVISMDKKLPIQMLSKMN